MHARMEVPVPTGTRNITLLYGRSGMALAVPEDAVVLEGPATRPLPDPEGAVRAALADPIGAPPLAELVQQRRPATVAITISDITRPVPNELIVTALLEVLNAAGVSDDRVRVIIGTGMHRPSTPEERAELLGARLLSRCTVIDHRADEPDGLVRVSSDPPVSISRRFVEADFRIVTGLIEPHFMAGYSGGRKGVCPALADAPTIFRFHRHAILADPRSATGVLDGNPCHAESLRVARLVGVDFLANVAIDRERRLAGVYCGDMEAAHLAGAGQVGQWTRALVDGPFDLVLSNGGGYPLDQTFYQTVKGMVAPLAALDERSTLLVTGHCGEGIGSPPYTETMRRWGRDWRGFLDHIKSTPEVVKDQWQYQMHARTLQRIGAQRLWLATDALDADLLATLAVRPVPGDGDARRRAQCFIDTFLSDNPGARVAVLPEGPYTMVCRR